MVCCQVEYAPNVIVSAARADLATDPAGSHHLDYGFRNCEPESATILDGAAPLVCALVRGRV
jgi:hypothetical protein